MAALLAIRTILGLPFLTIFIGPGIKFITFVHITDALTAMFFGPIAGMAFGFAGDFLGFLASGGAGGVYFPGFAFSEMATCFIFACFFFKRKITVPRVTIAWLINLFAVLIGLNTLWLMLVYGMGTIESFGLAYIELFHINDMNPREAFVAGRVALNAIQAPLHIFILFVLLSRIRRIRNLERYLS